MLYGKNFKSEMKKGIIILGSSNSKGETYKAAKYIADQSGYPIVDLRALNILPFDYEFKNFNDDFLPLIREIVNNYDLIIAATPVYWYTMSGTMKIFFDRISDCLKTEKETGRKLRGMDLAVLTSASDKLLKNGFHMPFIETANYLGMNYTGNVHSWIEDGKIPNEVIKNLDDFIKRISQGQTIAA
jgi:multimeric flavodoxin WrbA